MDYMWIAYLLLSFSPNYIDGSVQINKRSLHSEKPPMFESYRECNRSFINNFSKVILKTMCKPRPMPVDITPPYSNILTIPNKVVVNRCDGMCHAKQSCLPTEKKTVQVMVQQMDLLQHDGMPKCGVVHVEEHIRCKCKCTVMKEHCNAKQRKEYTTSFDPSTSFSSEELSKLDVTSFLCVEYQAGECMCLCMNSEERRKCIQAGKTWDDEKCSCMCPIQKECTTPFVWLRDYCRCAKLMGEGEMVNEETVNEEN